MKDTVYSFLKLMYHDSTWPNPDPGECVAAVWEAPANAIADLSDAYFELLDAEANDGIYQQLSDEALEHFDVAILFIREHFSITKKLLLNGFNVHEGGVSLLLETYTSGDASLKANIALMLPQVRGAEEGVSILTENILRHSAEESDEASRRAAAFALGKIARGSKEAVDALVIVAQNANESQAIRSFCIEALMDMGPDAKSATEILQEIYLRDKDEDMRMFAWAALKSVTASSTEHPCGGTVAEHMRSLYRSE